MTVQYARQIFMYSWDCARRRDSKRSGQVQETVESVPFILSFFSLSLSLVLKGDSSGSITRGSRSLLNILLLLFYNSIQNNTGLPEIIGLQPVKSVIEARSEIPTASRAQ